MATCRFQNQDGQRCGMPHGHELEHGNGLLIQGANQVWTEIPIPVFTIKASDPFACALIRTWMILARSFRQTQADGTTKTVDSRNP